MQIAIKIIEVSKYYLIAEHNPAKNKISTSSRKKKFWALKNINIEIEAGKAIAITGPNGSGKSTLLKMIAEITNPSEGIITINGKVVSILEIGVGFNPELSGKENIFLSAGLHGMNKKGIEKKLPNIIELFGFSEFLETPVKYYSSGMYMRLAFSVITQIEADIYLFDEVLSVGDVAFQSRAIEEIKRLKRSGTTICIVTHNPNQIAELCDSMLVLNKGNVAFIGSSGEALVEFQKIMANPGSEEQKYNYTISKDALAAIKNQLALKENFSFAALNLFISNESGNNICVEVEKEIRLRLDFEYQSDIPVTVGFLIKDRYQTVISSVLKEIASSAVESRFYVEVVIPENTFNPSIYLFDVFAIVENTLSVLYPNALKCNFLSTQKNGTTLGYLNTCCTVNSGKL